MATILVNVSVTIFDGTAQTSSFNETLPDSAIGDDPSRFAGESARTIDEAKRRVVAAVAGRYGNPS